VYQREASRDLTYRRWLSCHHTQQEWGQDEVYLKLDGIQVFRDDHMTKGHSDPLDITESVTIPAHSSSSFQLELWEDDGDHWYDRNDFLGSVTVNTAQAGQDHGPASFTQDGAGYELFYTIDKS